ncbi:MAG: phosphatidylserine/phosphatidylglycerophosphate/cardiolipin synthase family protein [Proteobacteria bacterium]|nr:phosphatidylserine/phosphatidylglycerophosphate/cardiolipin synthase family protein [Pseudomonadota bacterium]
MKHAGILAVLLLAVLALDGCAVDPLHARRAAATAAAAQDHALTCHAADACAIASPYQKLADAAFDESRPEAPVHFANLLDRGADSLLLRVHLIRAARKSIDIQTFIFAQDDAGYLVLDELVKAARRGVRVRVIVDQLFSLDDVELLAQLARAHANFELRVYNPTFHKARTPPLEFAAGIACCFFRFNQRMHNKLFLVDDRIGIAGGRNYENRYFDWDEDFDYRDRDVLVAGPAAQAMSVSFEAFWHDRRSVPLSRLRDVSSRILADGLNAPHYAMHAYRDAARVDALSRAANDDDYVRAHFADAAMRVGEIEYFSDAPDKFDEPEQPRDDELSRHILALFQNAQSEIVMQTPYLVLSRTARGVFAKQHRDQPGLDIIVSTNSLAATDAFYVYALSYKYKKRYLKLGFRIHEFKPFPDEASALIADYAALGGGAASTQRYRKYGRAPLRERGVRVGLHAKSIVIDGRIALIGSHNFDPRSDHYNTESGFIIHDRAFAQVLRASILRDCAPGNAWTIARRQGTNWISRLNRAIGDFSARLPLFDLWPYRYASSFELMPGCQPLPPGAPDFYACYTDVGDFPEVDLPLKTIYTRIVTAFGAGLHSIL